MKQLKDLNLSRWELEAGNPDLDRDILCVSWVFGGMTGGSCYGGANHSREAEPEPVFSELDEWLEQNCPAITYLQYKKIDALVKTVDRHISEYYGNCIEQRTKYIFVDELEALIAQLLGRTVGGA